MHLERLDAAVAAFPRTVQAELSRLLAVLHTARGATAWPGSASHGATPSVAEVQRSLERMRISRSELRQQAYHALRDLTNAAYFADASGWSCLGYPGPMSDRIVDAFMNDIPDPVRDGLARGWKVLGGAARRAASDARPATWRSSAAAPAAASRRNCSRWPASTWCMIEEGPLQIQQRLPHARARRLSALYQECAARKTADKAINILQGRCVGGSHDRQLDRALPHAAADARRTGARTSASPDFGDGDSRRGSTQRRSAA